jgi:asparagine synthase (glutamine-hydrolysing)
MCGIAGYTSSLGPTSQAEVSAVRRMTHRMSARGPDADGLWTGDGAVLGHRRLSIIDLDSRANQPMLSPDGRYCLVFNGEIYNFRQLRSELETQGQVFRTTSDSEVLLTLYARKQEQMLPKLRGMFAFAIWDTFARELFLARDPYGIKPLYYMQMGNGVLFASQVKGLLASGLVDPDIEPAGLAGFYLWGNVPEPWTLYRGVMALPAGSWMHVHRGVAQTPVCWHDIRVHWRQRQYPLRPEEVRQRLRQAVTESVRAHLVADVPVSVFLSGGIDSASIIGLVSQLGAKVEGITIGFREFEELRQDEVPVAAAVASHYGFDHHVRQVTREEFEEDLPRFIEAMDQPTIDGVNTWFASKAAAERGYKVVLSGVGGDELLYGYSLAREIPRSALRNRMIAAIPGARSLLNTAIDTLAGSRFHPKLKGVSEFMGTLAGEYFLRRSLFLPSELPTLMGEEWAQSGLERLGDYPPGIQRVDAVNPEGATCMLDSTLYLRNQLLRDSDWASMAHSLELRTPLVDAELLHALDTIHAHFVHGNGKRFLAQSPEKALPEEIIKRRKTGFAVPMTQWLRDATGPLSWDHSPLLAPEKTPWTRRWASVVIQSFLKSGSHVQLKAG